MTRARVLVIDDDGDIRALVAGLLERAGYEVNEASDGRDGLRSVFSDRPDLVLLDVTMPGLDGWAALERIRELTDVPVLMLTARSDELEKVRGLKAGADDYMTKPFGRQELLARVEALLRRKRSAQGELPTVYADDAITVEFAQRSAQSDGVDLRLTPLEFRLLSAFVQHPNQVLSREQLLELAWGDPYGVSEDQVKLYVGYLRKKLGMNVGTESPIETVRGFGYRYRPVRV
ncbi:MAG: response regulator transcription factor [Actinomycetota bacterium]|nr:response regulator transcription factor [Actinomycetota bacterium]